MRSPDAIPRRAPDPGPWPFPGEPSCDILSTPDDERFMRLAIAQSRLAWEEGEVPVGAVAVADGRVIGRARNQVETLQDATAHAEMLLLTQCAASLGAWRLNGVTLYVTKEPCAMCAGAMVNSRLGRLVFGMSDPRCGAAGGALDVARFPGGLHRVEVSPPVLEEECRMIFQAFFRAVRRAEPPSG